MPEFEFSGRDLTDLSRNIRRAAVDLRAEVDKTVAEVGAEIKGAASEIASQHSESIPPTIRLEMTPGTAIIKAGGGVPLALLYEEGNKGKGGRKSETFRHPVFGTNVWVEQKRYPFLRPALKSMRRQITKRMEQAWDDALKPLGRH